MKKLMHFQIIASLASVPNKHAKKNIISNLIDRVVASIIYYDKVIDYGALINTCNKLNDTTDFFNKKKLIVINVREFDHFEPRLVANNNCIKVVNINLFQFLSTVSTKIMERQNIVNKLESDTPKSFNPDLFNKFSFLNKLNLMDLLENEDPNSIDRNYNLIFIFHDILWKNVVALLKNVGIEVYGGSGTRRHVISTVQANLVSFIMLLNNLDLDNSLIYKSFNAMEAYEKKIDLGLFMITHPGNLNRLIEDRDIFQHFLEITEGQRGCFDEYFILKLNLALALIAKIQEFAKEIKSVEDSIQKIEFEMSEDVKRKLNVSHNVEKKLQNIENRNKINKDKLLKLDKEMTELKKTCDIYADCLYFLDPNYFPGEEGCC
jgi:hypothetical protein